MIVTTSSLQVNRSSHEYLILQFQDESGTVIDLSSAALVFKVEDCFEIEPSPLGSDAQQRVVALTPELSALIGDKPRAFELVARDSSNKDAAVWSGVITAVGLPPSTRPTQESEAPIDVTASGRTVVIRQSSSTPIRIITQNVSATGGGSDSPGPAGKSAYEVAVEQGFSGNASQWLASLAGSKGDTGNAGLDGEDGQAATISIGTTTTGAPGSQAQVVNTGSANAAVLNFTIPAGEPGSGGGNAGVSTFNTRTGAITLSDADVTGALGFTPAAAGHGHTIANITGLQTALDGKEPSITSGTTSQYLRGDKSWQTLDKVAVGLGNVSNTSDANKPISTATQDALNLKANLASPSFTGTVSGISKAMVGLGNVDNTADANKPISSAAQTALNGKEPTITTRQVAMTIGGGALSANELVGGFTAIEALTFNSASCLAFAEATSTGSAVFSIRNNGSQIGTVTFSPGSSTGSYNFTSTTVTSGQRISIRAPSSADATITDVTFDLRFTR